MDGASRSPSRRPRVCAVSYLNTVPLVWGMLHGPQMGLFDLSFCLPSECADRVEQAGADIGIVPTVALPRLGLEIISGEGIACRGPARSILLISRKPFPQIRSLAADSASRSSIVLARIVLAERYGAVPRILSMPADLESMLAAADAAVMIGDPALRLDPASMPYDTADLGAEWYAMTGKPMVFAVWAGRPPGAFSALEPAFAGSCRYGLDHLEEIIREESRRRRIPEALVRDYLTRHIVFELGNEELEGMNLFLRSASRIEDLAPARSLSA